MAQDCATAVVDEDRCGACFYIVGVRLRRYPRELWAMDHGFYLVVVRRVLDWLRLLTATVTATGVNGRRSRSAVGWRCQGWSSRSWGAPLGPVGLDQACSAGSRSRSGRAYSGNQASVGQPGTRERMTAVRSRGTEPVMRIAT